MPRVGYTFVRRKTGETGMNLRPDTPATQKDGSSAWQPKKRFVNISGLRSRRLKIGGVTKSGGNHKSTWTCNSSQAIEHQPELFLGTFTKDEIHEWAERLRQAKDDSESG